jgi:hypothetical protein
MNTLFGYGTGVEKLGMGSVDAGLSIGNAATTAGTNQGKLIAGQEDARVAAENTGSLFDNLLSSALQAGVSYATGGIGNSIGGWAGKLFSSAPAAGTSNVSPGIRF